MAIKVCVPACAAQVGSLSVEWLAEERTQVVGTFPPKKKGWTGLIEKDTAGQTNIYSVEVPIQSCHHFFSFLLLSIPK